ncbi:MAG: oligosaccharide flippase family protein [Balneolaceae bacterium]|nr:oligosaccharide flippase family protein [Balneolaceae bacterium]
MIASAFSFVIALFLKYRPFEKSLSSISGISYKEIFAYSVPLMTASIYGIMFRSADKFYISRYFGEEVFAEYANGFIQLPFVGMIAGATSAVLLPLFSKKMENPDSGDKILAVWKSAWKKSALIIYPLLLYFLFYAENVVIILYGENYYGSIIYFRLALFINFFNIIMFTPVILAMGETKFYSFVHLVVAGLIWMMGYGVIFFEGTPFLIGLMVVLLSIFKAIWLILFVAEKMQWSFKNLVPINFLAKIIFHS